MKKSLIGCISICAIAGICSSSVFAAFKVIPNTPSWLIQIGAPIKGIPSATVVVTDLFDTSTDTIANLSKNGKYVICYFSAGSYEDWRPDARLYSKSVLGKDLSGWAWEKWADIRSQSVRSILKSRIALAASKGCAGVDPDNIDGYGNATGFPLTETHSVELITDLTNYAHSKNLSLWLKNGGLIVTQVASLVDFAITEQCQVYNECSLYNPLIALNKTVIDIEYSGNLSRLCRKTATPGMLLYKANLKLDKPGKSCP